jgi:hypothetical protein
MSERIQSAVLKLESEVIIPAIGRFAIGEKVRVGEVVDRIRVVSLGKNFKEVFLDEIEEAIETEKLRWHILEKAIRDLAILSKLDGEGEKAKILFSQFWEFLKTAGQKDFMAYIHKKGNLWAVSSKWFVYGGRHFGANVVDYKCPYPYDWPPGTEILSH